MGAGLNVGGARRRARSRVPISQINVTPFVDVMLVLLVIFMVTAPLLTVGVEVDLPETAARQLTGDDEPLTVSITKDSAIHLQETQIELDELVPKLNAITERKPDARIFVRADREIPYGRVMEVMGALNGAGFSNVGLVTETLKEPK